MLTVYQNYFVKWCKICIFFCCWIILIFLM